MVVGRPGPGTYCGWWIALVGGAMDRDLVLNKQCWIAMNYWGSLGLLLDMYVPV